MTGPWYADDAVTVWHGDCLHVLADMADNSVDAVVTDPPYGLEFMGKDWDRFAATGSSALFHSPKDEGREFTNDSGHMWDNTKALPRFPRAGLAYQQWCQQWATQCLRVLKPGGHMLAFGGTRTWHRLTVAIEDAGFEIRDTVADLTGIDGPALLWMYGSGFPKSLDVSKAIDRQRSEDRTPVDVVRAWLNERRLEAGISHDSVNKHFGHANTGGGSSSAWMTNPTSRSLPTWEQWQQLKNLFSFGDDMDAEVWRLNGRKGTPGEAWGQREQLGMSDNLLGRRSGIAGGASDHYTVGGTRAEAYAITAPATPEARQWAGWGTALKPSWEPIIVARKPLAGTVAGNVLQYGTGGLNIDASRIHTAGSEGKPYTVKRLKPGATLEKTGGNWRPDNDTDLPWEAGREYQGQTQDGRWPPNLVLGAAAAHQLDQQSGNSTSQQHDRDDQPLDTQGMGWRFRRKPGGFNDSGGASRFFPVFRYEAKAPTAERPRSDDATAHPTVKPLDLIRWLVTLVTPPGGLILDPFAGSGTTGEAAIIEGFHAILIEREADYLPMIRARLTKPIQPVLDLGGGAV